jgi:phosphopantothenate---cysteine ligase (ATP)
MASAPTTNNGDNNPQIPPLHAAEHDYFATNPAPKALAQHLSLARAFISEHSADGRKVALVTSGGTTVPLENQTVRFIDNFSAGTRGATSAEYFLSEGYAVIFLHRQFSLLPFSRHYSHNTRSFLDFMTEDEDGRVVVDEEHQHEMREVLREYTKAKRSNMLLILSFVTITEYLWELREVAKLMRPLGAKAVFYLAAAVSDFFVPRDRMVEHKIQSNEEFAAEQTKQLREMRDGDVFGSDSESNYSNNHHSSTLTKNRKPKPPPAARTEGKSLIIDLSPVPKFLKQLVDGWAPLAMIVSFKLETDPALLVRKARHSLDKYAHHLVIGNLLTTRKWEVVFISKELENDGGRGVKWVRVPRGRRAKSFSGIEALVGMASGEVDEDGGGEEAHRFVGEPPVEIEGLIVPEIARMHDRLIERSKGA